MHEFTRRHWLKSLLFGSNLLGLRALASGIPPWALRTPASILALDDSQVQRALAVDIKPQFLLMSASDQGEPINCNAPGMYENPDFKHPGRDEMAATAFALGDTQVTAAKVWSTLPAASLARTCFFHHATRNLQHGGLGGVHKLSGAMAGGEMMVSAMGKLLQEPLGCLQAQPISIGRGGSESLTAAGSELPTYSPTGLRDLLTTPEALAKFSKTQALRDRDLDAIANVLRASGSPMQKKLLDSWASSTQQARTLPKDLLQRLVGLPDDSAASQMSAAVLLFQFKLTPVVVTHIGFGDDNHTDNDNHAGPGALPLEGSQHVSGVQTLNRFFTEVSTAGLQDNVTLTTLTTFGRSNAPNLSGRGHNESHSVNLIIGAKVKGSVVGGAKLQGINFQAQSIDSSTGAAGGGIAEGETLAAYGATLGQAVGLNAAQIEKIIPGGQVVTAALS